MCLCGWKKELPLLYLGYHTENTWGIGYLERTRRKYFHVFIVILKFEICLLIDTRSKHILNSAVFHKNTWRVWKELDKKPLVSKIVSFAVLQFAHKQLHKPKPNGRFFETNFVSSSKYTGI